MQMLQLKCPSCGGILEVEDSLDTFYCRYCGTKIVLAEQSDQLIKAKVDMAKLSHEERMYKLKIEEKKREDKSATITAISIIAFCVISILLMYGCSTGRF